MEKVDNIQEQIESINKQMYKLRNTVKNRTHIIYWIETLKRTSCRRL